MSGGGGVQLPGGPGASERPHDASRRCARAQRLELGALTAHRHQSVQLTVFASRSGRRAVACRPTSGCAGRRSRTWRVREVGRGALSQQGPEERSRAGRHGHPRPVASRLGPGSRPARTGPRDRAPRRRPARCLAPATPPKGLVACTRIGAIKRTRRRKGKPGTGNIRIIRNRFRYGKRHTPPAPLLKKTLSRG
jgi:hypothetical protein